ncbi:MAG: FRG domain-containing protein [Bryobacteraceae bacterium]
MQTVSDIRQSWSGEFLAEPWFRSQADASCQLTRVYTERTNPTKMRLATNADVEVFTCFSGPAATDWEWYFLMQHHGAPTRLLDWSGATT